MTNCIDCESLKVSLASIVDRKEPYGYCWIRGFYIWQPERNCTAFDETADKDPATSVRAARRHHLKHGDMDGSICLLSKCALHYPAGRIDPLRSKKRQIDEYLSSKDPTDYGAIPIGGDAYNTAGLIVIRLDEHGLRLSDGTATEDVSDKSVAEIVETIEDWAQTLREGAE